MAEFDPQLELQIRAAIDEGIQRRLSQARKYLAAVSALGAMAFVAMGPVLMEAIRRLAKDAAYQSLQGEFEAPLKHLQKSIAAANEEVEQITVARNKMERALASSPSMTAERFIQSGDAAFDRDNRHEAELFYQAAREILKVRIDMLNAAQSTSDDREKIAALDGLCKLRLAILSAVESAERLATKRNH